jgi:hypothetical protein
MEVADRAKGVTLQALSSALVARDMPASRQAMALMQEEEAGGGGAATVLCHGARLTKAGAAFVNAAAALGPARKSESSRCRHSCCGARQGRFVCDSPLEGADSNPRSLSG